MSAQHSFTDDDFWGQVANDQLAEPELEPVTVPALVPPPKPTPKSRRRQRPAAPEHQTSGGERVGNRRGRLMAGLAIFAVLLCTVAAMSTRPQNVTTTPAPRPQHAEPLPTPRTAEATHPARRAAVAKPRTRKTVKKPKHPRHAATPPAAATPVVVHQTAPAPAPARAAAGCDFVPDC